MIPFQLSSNLNHTWIIDIDGTIFEHNGYLNGEDQILPGVQDLWLSIPLSDVIILLTARSEKYRTFTEQSLSYHNLRYNFLITGVPTGERILINDIKPEGLKTAISWNIERNKGFI